MRDGWAKYQLLCAKDGKVSRKSAETFSDAVAKKNNLLKKHKYDKIEIKEREERMPQKERNSINELRGVCGLPPI